MKRQLVLLLLVMYTASGFSDEPAVHGMLLFGKNANYISHLPMFHSPHDYQFIASVDLIEKKSGTTLKRYERIKNAEKIFTISPKPMDLSKVLRGEITSFEVTIYDGHFERGGTPIGPAMVKVKRILIGEKIAKDKGPSSDFLSFGQGGEYYLAHVITGQPTYDAIYATGNPVQTMYPPCGRARCPEPVSVPVPDNELPVKITTDNAQMSLLHPQNTSIGTALGIRITVKTPFYVEYNELTH